MSAEGITLNAHCHCGHANYTYTLPASSFPLKSSICSCDSCRHVTGMLAASFAVIPAPRPDVAHLTAYASSDAFTRYFCPTCGAHVCNFEADEWEFATGMLDNTGGLLDRVQMWIEDTKDGGLSLWLPEIGGSKTKRVMRGRHSEEFSEAKLKVLMGGAATADAGSEDRLHARCHCGGVQFFVTRPTHEPEGDEKRGKWWLRGNKYAAILDACTSCRLVTGFEILSWCFAPPNNIFMMDGSPLDVSSGTLKRYQSSSGIHREFCGKCGATVFFRKDGRSRDIIDIAVGLLREENGARADNWLEWLTMDGKLAHAEDAIDKELVEALAQGLRTRGHGLWV